MIKKTKTKNHCILHGFISSFFFYLKKLNFLKTCFQTKSRDQWFVPWIYLLVGFFHLRFTLKVSFLFCFSLRMTSKIWNWTLNFILLTHAAQSNLMWWWMPFSTCMKVYHSFSTMIMCYSFPVLVFLIAAKTVLGVSSFTWEGWWKIPKKVMSGAFCALSVWLHCAIINHNQKNYQYTRKSECVIKVFSCWPRVIHHHTEHTRLLLLVKVLHKRVTLVTFITFYLFLIAPCRAQLDRLSSLKPSKCWG